MAPSHKLSRSGYKITDVYTELDIALLATDHERACSLAAELSCSGGGQARSLVTHLINKYCDRCVNSGRAQMSLLRSSLAHVGDGTPQSPRDGACLNEQFRRGLCTLTLLVASSDHCHREGSRDVTAAFASVPRAESMPSLALTIEALRHATVGGDARTMSSIIRAIPDDAWCRFQGEGGAGFGQGMPDVQRLRAVQRRDPVWDVWRLACELAQVKGVSEYVGDCLHAFAWGFNCSVRRARIHLLWYAFLVIAKGSPRAGPHPINPDLFEKALSSIDAVFDEVLSGAMATDTGSYEKTKAHVKTKAMERAENEAAAMLDLDARTRYLLTITKPDPGRVWEVERDREEALEGRRQMESDGQGHSIKLVVVKASHVIRSPHKQKNKLMYARGEPSHGPLHSAFSGHLPMMGTGMRRL